MPRKTLSPEDEKLLAEPMLLHVGTYCEAGKSFEFEIEVDARPLALLIIEAVKGHRVYELLSIDRPGDILNYLWVRVTDRATHLAENVTRQFNRARRFLKPQESVRELAFTEFDGYFWFDYDDTRDDASRWLDYRESPGWRQRFAKLVPVVRRAQASLKQKEDFLVQHEVTLMAEARHHLDFGAKVVRDGQLRPGVPTQTTLPPDLFELIVRLAKQEDVRSVSCPFTDYWLWRELVAEQVRRSIAQGVEPMAALQLNGPDSGIPYVKAGARRVDLEWGGEVHIPLEGACPADLFVQPDWRGFNIAEARVAPTLSQAVFGLHTSLGERICAYLLTRSHTLGEIACARRTEIGEWVFYEPRR